MKLVRWTAGLLSAGLLAAVGLVGAGLAPASAVTTPPWEPDVSGLGTLTLYNASGAVITSGNLADIPFAAYVRTSGPGRVGDTKATLSMATPNHSQPTGNWPVSGLSASTNYPNSAAPAPIKNFTNPVVTLGSTDGSLQSVIGVQPNNDMTAGYVNMYQLRVQTSGPGHPASGSYFTADIMVDSGAGTWTQVYPAGVTLKVPTLTVTSSPAKPAYGSTRTLNVKVAASGVTATGKVTVKEGTKTVGSASLVSGVGKVSISKTLSVKKHSLSISYAGDENVAAATKVFALTVVKATAKLTIKAAHGSISHSKTDKLTISLKVTGVVASGKVTIKDGKKTLKVVTLKKGAATYTLAKLKAGKHKISVSYAGSSTVNKVAKTVTITAT